MAFSSDSGSQQFGSMRSQLDELRRKIQANIEAKRAGKPLSSANPDQVDPQDSGSGNRYGVTRRGRS